MIENLVEILHSFIDLYREVLELSVQKKAAIVSNNVERVGESAKAEWELLGRIALIEERRLQIMREIADEKTIEEVKDLRLMDLLKWCSPEEAEAVNDAAEELKKLIAEQKKMNMENQALIGLHLDYTDYMINVFYKEPQTSNIYSNSGEVEEEHFDNRGIIDSSI